MPRSPNSVLALSGPGLSRIDRAATPNRASDRVFSELVRAIRDLRLAPGTSLSETALAVQLGVSRTPLRAAIAQLAEDGLVQVVPQVGTRVSLIRLRDVEEARFIRESLEVAAVEAAASDPHRDVAILHVLLDEQRRAWRTRDYERFFEADERMHEQVFVLSGFPGAWRTIQRTKLQLDRLRRLSLPEPKTLRQLLEDHTAIVAALESGDVDGGRDHVRTHARRVLQHAPALRLKHPEYFVD